VEEARTQDRPHAAFWVGTALVLATAGVLRWQGIGQDSLWFDEGLSLGRARMAWGDFVSRLWMTDLSNQAFYYLLLRPWTAFGESEGWIRGLSALCSAATVAVVAAVGRRLAGSAAGLLAAALLAMHWFAVRFAHEARGYALSALLLALAALALVRWVDEGRRRDLAAWVAACALALHAHFFAVFAVAAQVASLAVLGPRFLRPRLGDLARAAVGLAVAAIPMVAAAFGPSSTSIDWIRRVHVAKALEYLSCLGGGDLDALKLYAVLFSVTVVRAAIEKDAARRWRASFATFAAVLPPLAMLAVSVWKPVFFYRYLALFVPFWPLAAAVALLPRRITKLHAVVGTLVALLLGAEEISQLVRPRAPLEDWRSPAARVAEATNPGDAILYLSPRAGVTFEYYLDRSSQRPERLQHGDLMLAGSQFDLTEAKSRDRVWVVYSRDSRLARWNWSVALRQTHPNSSEFWNAGVMSVWLYTK
jgi:mannosyltransferase